MILYIIMNILTFSTAIKVRTPYFTGEDSLRANTNADYVEEQPLDSQREEPLYSVYGVSDKKAHSNPMANVLGSNIAMNEGLCAPSISGYKNSYRGYTLSDDEEGVKALKRNGIKTVINCSEFMDYGDLNFTF